MATRRLDVVLATYLCQDCEGWLRYAVFADYDLWHLKNGPCSHIDLLHERNLPLSLSSNFLGIFSHSWASSFIHLSMWQIILEHFQCSQSLSSPLPSKSQCPVSNEIWAPRVSFLGMLPVQPCLAPCLECSSVAILKFLIIFWLGPPHFHFALAPENHMAHPNGSFSPVTFVLYRSK